MTPFHLAIRVALATAVIFYAFAIFWERRRGKMQGWKLVFALVSLGFFAFVFAANIFRW